MNNTWNTDQYQMPNMMNMPPMMQSMMPPPLMPPMCMMNEMAMPLPGNPPLPAGPPTPIIGPVMPDNLEQGAEDMNVVGQDSDNEEQQKNQKSKDRERRDQRDSRDRSRQPRARSRDRYDRNRDNDRGNIGRNDRNSRNERNDRSDRNDRNRRERRSKWDGPKDNEQSQGQGNGLGMGMMMQTGGLPYNTMNTMPQQPMDMQHMTATMSNIPPNMMASNNMQNMMPGTNMMQGNNMMAGNMMPNMMGNYDQNMMMMNQQQMMPIMNQPIFVNGAALLPPVPGVTTPNRREKPPGCRTIFVGGLPNGIREDVIGEIFHRFGGISDVKLHRQGVCHVRFDKQESVEQAFFISGFRFKSHDQTDNEATTLFIDYALNRDDQSEYEKNKRNREPTPPRVEPYSSQALVAITDKIKSDEQFIEAGPTLAVWLERGECNKKNASTFYSLIQASNNQVRRLFTEKMALDDEYQTLKSSLRDKFASVVTQFEQVAKILTAAKHQRVSDHFTKQQRRNIEMWLKMTEELDNLKEEFSANFDEEEIEKIGKNMVPAEKYEELKAENENLMYELEGYKNEAFLAKDEAERKFETFKAHFVAQQALQHNQGSFPPLPPMAKRNDPPLPAIVKPLPPPPTPDDNKVITSGPAVPPSEAKLISILTAFLMVHPLGASLDYLVSYVRSMVPNVTQATVHTVLQKYCDVFCCKTSGIGASIEHRWGFVTFDIIKSEA